jgi:ABC-type Fe3+/spermidine/putrescine transport system ATPase subunit
MPEPDAHVRLVGLTKRFPGGAGAAVDNVSLDIPRGSFTTLLGPSGCGKTTTLRIIAGFYEPDAGEVFIGDRRITQLPVHRRRTAMVFQDYALFPHMDVAENVGYGLRLAHLERAAIQKRVGDTLEFLGLSGLDKRFPGQLSGGQQQRVALARALVSRPQIILADEPTGQLDSNTGREIIALMRRLVDEHAITFLIVTHDPVVVESADTVHELRDGKLVS